MQQPTSLPPIPLSNSSLSQSTFPKQIIPNNLPSFDPFVSLDNVPCQPGSYSKINFTEERPPSPTRSNIVFPTNISNDVDSNIELPEVEPEHLKPVETMTDPLSNVKPMVYDNPWDLVPDQPMINALSTSSTISNNQGDVNSQNITQELVSKLLF